MHRRYLITVKPDAGLESNDVKKSSDSSVQVLLHFIALMFVSTTCPTDAFVDVQVNIFTIILPLTQSTQSITIVVFNK